MKMPEIVVLNITNFQFINKPTRSRHFGKAENIAISFTGLWRKFIQILGCVFVVGWMRYGEGKDMLQKRLT